MPRKISLCADDYGISPAVNVAIRDLVVRRRLSATSVMVAAPSLHQAEALALATLARTSRVAIGLHVTLSAPFAPLSKGFAPLRKGAFLPLPRLLVHAMLRRLHPDLLYAEVAQQVRAFTALFGRAPDYLDGHQHVQLFPQIRDAVLAAAKGLAPGGWVRQCGAVRAPAIFSDPKGALIHALSRSFRRRAHALGVSTNPAFAGTYQFNAQADIAALFPRFLDGLPDGGVVMCHPGFVDAELARLDPLTDLRAREFAYFAGDAFPAALEAQGMTLA
jgi:chitin disaccharide deacetylase